LRPWLEGYITFFKNVCNGVLWKLVKIAANGPIDIGALPMGPSTVKVISIGPDLLKYDLGIYVDVATSEYYQMLRQNLMEMRERIPVDAYFLVLNTLQQADFRKAELYLTKFSQIASNQEHQRALEVAEATAKANAEAAIAAEQERQKSHQMDVMAKIEAIRAEYEAKEVLAQGDHERKLDYLEKETESKKDVGIAITQVNNQNRLEQ
jgi:hypothetical protein